MKIFNVEQFQGIFPRKGRLEAKVDGEWYPVDGKTEGKDFVLGEYKLIGENYVPEKVLSMLDSGGYTLAFKDHVRLPLNKRVKVADFHCFSNGVTISPGDEIVLARPGDEVNLPTIWVI